MRIDPQSLARSIRATIRRPILAALPLAVAATSALVPAATPAAAQSAAPVTLYRDINYLSYSGPPITLSANIPDLKTVGFNDMASSLTVPAGTKVALFQHANYLGACAVFTANDPDLRDNIVDNLVLNDNVSSVLFGQDCPLQLYDSAGYNGPFRTFWNDVPNLAQYSFDNTVASLRVPPGKKVTAYSDPNYGGICEEFTADDPDLSNNPSGTARISSVRLGVSCPAQVVLFENLNYQGAFIKFDSSGFVRLQDVGWAGRVSSVYVAGGAGVTLSYTKQVCEPVTFSLQYCHSEDVSSWFSVSTPDLRTTTVGEDSADYADIVI